MSSRTLDQRLAPWRIPVYIFAVCYTAVAAAGVVAAVSAAATGHSSLALRLSIAAAVSFPAAVVLAAISLILRGHE